MPEKTGPAPGVNRWIEDELRLQYQHDRTVVDDSWAREFDANGSEAARGAPQAQVAAQQPAIPPPITRTSVSIIFSRAIGFPPPVFKNNLGLRSFDN